MKTPILLTLLASAALFCACSGLNSILPHTGAVEQIRAPRTNADGTITPGVAYTNAELSPRLVNGVQALDTVASAAGIPWAHTVATGILGLGALALGILNKRGHERILAALSEDDTPAAPGAKQ